MLVKRILLLKDINRDVEWREIIIMLPSAR